MVTNDLHNLLNMTVADAVEIKHVAKLNRRVWLSACRDAIERDKNFLKQGVESDFPEALELTDDELLEAMKEVLVDYEPFCSHEAQELAQLDNYDLRLERRDRQFGPYLMWF